MSKWLALVAAVLGIASVVATFPPGTGAVGAEREAVTGAAGTFSFRVEVPWAGAPAVCARGYGANVGCYAHPGGPVGSPGMGFVSQAYEYAVEMDSRPLCSAGQVRVLGYPARLTVRGKGEIMLAVEAADGCYEGPPADTVLSPTQAFTITGGSGVYAGASGSGVLTRARTGRSNLTGHGLGTDVWEGTLIAPNVSMLDLTAPTISGAVAKVVRTTRKATRIPVRYLVSATDDVDGTVPVDCKPRSGSLFRVGRTLVRCTAADLSANTTTASFPVTIRRR
jgi:HYR domain